MKITDKEILEALRAGKSIRLPNFTSNDEFFLALNGCTITTRGRQFMTGNLNSPIPMQVDLLESNDWEVVDETKQDK